MNLPLRNGSFEKPRHQTSAELIVSLNGFNGSNGASVFVGLCIVAFDFARPSLSSSSSSSSLLFTGGFPSASSNAIRAANAISYLSADAIASAASIYSFKSHQNEWLIVLIDKPSVSFLFNFSIALSIHFFIGFCSSIKSFCLSIIFDS